MMMLIIFLITDISMVSASLPESMEILQNTGKEC